VTPAGVPAMPERIAERLLTILGDLPAVQAEQLLEYAEFLHERHGGDQEASAPLDIPRPAEESVIRAIRRLHATYPMLDPAKLLREASELMTQHVTQGRAAVEVIEELEVLFRAHYERLSGGGES